GNVGALGHVAHVAEVAVLHHLPERGLRYFVHLAASRGVHGIEQRGKRVAEAEATAAAVADIEYAFELGFERSGIRKLGRAPIDRMARRSFQAPLATRAGCISHGAGDRRALPGDTGSARNRVLATTC